MNRIMRGAAGVLSLIVTLAIPSAVFASDSPPIIAQTNPIPGPTPTRTPVIASQVEVLDVTAREFLPPIEWQAFEEDLQHLPMDQRERIQAEMMAAGINTYSDGFQQIAPGVFLYQRQFYKCYLIDPWDAGLYSNCYGVIQFSLTNTQTQEERVIWTLPYHAQQEDGIKSCYRPPSGKIFLIPRRTVDQVLLHPTRDMLAVTILSFHRCHHAAFLIDYSGSAVTVTEIPDMMWLAWSPDATRLAYVEMDLQSCDKEVPYTCAFHYGVLDLATLEKTPFKEMRLDFYYGYFLSIDWIDDETLLYQYFTPADTVGTQVQYSLPDQ